MLRNAALFAVIGTLLWTILLAYELIKTVAGMGQGIVPAVTVLTSLIHFVAVLSLLIFFFAYRRSQS